MVRDNFKQRLERDAAPRTTSTEASTPARSESSASGFDRALMLILLIELSRYCPGMVTALGVSAGPTASVIDSRARPASASGGCPTCSPSIASGHGR
jgi:hypothetical protein